MNKIRKIEYDVQEEDLTIWFEYDSEPFNAREFEEGTTTRVILDTLEDIVTNFVELANRKFS